MNSLEIEDYKDPAFYAESPSWNSYGNIILILGLLFTAFFLVSMLLVFFF
ncbi:MAG: hypothetical protein KKE24_00895 [Candidatus Thermoplasmatota archaeon]|nr:hypothetical protein [Candidatus Thermoplasmatota archaeon]